MSSERLTRLLGGPETAWIVQRARQRMARRQGLVGRVVLRDPSAAERSAVQRLLGRPPARGSSLGLELADVDAVLRLSGACPGGLAEAVVLLGGPVVDLVDAAEAEAQLWRTALDPLMRDPRPELEGWREDLRRTGLVRRLAGSPESAAPLARAAATVIAALPANGEPRARLAARLVGHAHDLDDGHPLTTLVFGAARALGGVPDGAGAQWRRDVWEAVGVLRDDLSSTVICLGLPGASGTPLGRVLAEWAREHEPVTLTLRQVRRPELAASLGVAAGDEVFVCENPVVLSLAADRGAPAAPLICVNGRPGVAVTLLLRTLADGGARLRYHGDFDWGGVRIANSVMAQTGALPWRMGAADYRGAAARGLGRDLSGTAVEAVWDAGLAAAMVGAGLGIDEEHVVEDLLGDLLADG